MGDGAGENLRILQTSVDQLSGVDVQAESLQEDFARRGHVSDLIQHWWEGEYGVISEDESREDFPDLDSALGELEPGYDIVHFHSHSFDWEGKDRVVDSSGNPSVVYTAHSVVERSPGDEDYWYKELQYDHMKDADTVTTPSPYAKERLLDEHEPLLDERDMGREELEEKIEVVPNGTDFEKYVEDAEVEAKADYLKEDYIQRISPDASRIILFAGRHSPEKGLTDLANAFNQVGKSYEDAVLLYAGANGKDDKPDEGMMNRVASELDPSVEDRVRFTGRVERDELAALYNASDVFVSPTAEDYDNETFNMTIPEAAMMETPVVTSDHAAPKELFVDKGLAVGVEPSNPSSIAKGIDYVFSNPGESQRMAQTAKQHALNNYTMRSVADRWINDIYGPLVEGDDYEESAGIRVEDFNGGGELHDSPF